LDDLDAGTEGLGVLERGRDTIPAAVVAEIAVFMPGIIETSECIYESISF
jgi:hypothetical protein